MLIKGVVRGNPALWLENEQLRVGVLPQKGADIFEFTYRPTGVQLLMQTPWGLKAPGLKPPVEFLENYEGGWQELFPNHGDACVFDGQVMPMHGEVALLPWDVRILQDDVAETCLLLSVRCQKTPFLLERSLRLRAGTAQMEILEKVTNESELAMRICVGPPPHSG